MNRTVYYTMSILLVSVSCIRKGNETKPVRKDVTETVFASGVLEARNTFAITAQSEGYIASVHFRENDLVKNGQVLATVDNQQFTLNSRNAADLYEIARKNTSPDSPVLLQAQNSLKVASQKLQQDSIQMVRYKKLNDENSISRVEFENAVLRYHTSEAEYRNAVENLRMLKQKTEQELIVSRTEKNLSEWLNQFNQIRTPYAGRVYKKLKQPGDFVHRGEAIALIGDSGFLYAKVSIDEGSIAKVKPGQEAIIQLNVHNNKNYRGKVEEILPAFDEATQSFICRIHFLDPLDFKVINTQLQANIIIGVTKNALLIPRSHLGYGNTVRVKGTKEPVRVKTRFVSSEWVLVEHGIDENSVLIAP